jgi:hypothetical protein
MTQPIRFACKSTKALPTITMNAPIPRCHNARPRHRAVPHSASSIRITRGAKRHRDGETGGIATSTELVVSAQDVRSRSCLPADPMEGLIHGAWNIRLLPHYALGVFSVLAHRFHTAWTLNGHSVGICGVQEDSGVANLLPCGGAGLF